MIRAFRQRRAYHRAQWKIIASWHRARAAVARKHGDDPYSLGYLDGLDEALRTIAQELGQPQFD